MPTNLNPTSTAMPRWPAAVWAIAGLIVVVIAADVVVVPAVVAAAEVVGAPVAVADAARAVVDAAGTAGRGTRVNF